MERNTSFSGINYSSFILTDRPPSILCSNEIYLVTPAGSSKQDASNLLEVWKWEFPSNDKDIEVFNSVSEVDVMKHR